LIISDNHEKNQIPMKYLSTSGQLFISDGHVTFREKDNHVTFQGKDKTMLPALLVRGTSGFDHPEYPTRHPVMFIE
jgi:hypothetical protein